MTAPLKLHTTAELKDWPDQTELIEGEMVAQMSPSSRHTRIQTLILHRYWQFDPAENLGVLWPEPSVVLDQYNTPRPDLAWWNARRNPPVNDDTVKIIPDLVIEVLSPRDTEGLKHYTELMDKIRRYQVAGVSQTWVISPADQNVKIYVPGQPAPAKTLGRNEELDGTGLIDGFKIAINDLFT